MIRFTSYLKVIFGVGALIVISRIARLLEKRPALPLERNASFPLDKIVMVGDSTGDA